MRITAEMTFSGLLCVPGLFLPPLEPTNLSSSQSTYLCSWLHSQSLRLSLEGIPEHTVTKALQSCPPVSEKEGMPL